MIVLLFKNFIIFNFYLKGNFFEKFLIKCWPGKKYFFHSPNVGGSIITKEFIDSLYHKRGPLNINWFGVQKCDEIYFKSNQKNLKSIKNKSRKEDYFFKFYSHINYTKIADNNFKKLIVKKYLIDTKSLKFNFFKYFFDNYIFNFLSLIFCVTVIIFYLLKDILKNRLIKLNIKKTKGGILVDHCFGLKNKKLSLLNDTPLDDGFLLNINERITLKQLLIYDKNWPFKDIEVHKKKYEDMGVKILGSRSQRSELTFVGLIKIIFILCHYIYNMGSSLKLFSSSKYHLSLMKFICKSIIAAWDFDVICPSIYLSKIDYSSNHHPIGLACYIKKIHFSGISHSPSYGTYMPTNGIISFDSYFYYSRVFLEEFYPTWKLSHSDLIPIGVWRSDIVFRLKKLPSIKKYSFKLKAMYNCTKIVTLHLPVFQIYDIDIPTSKMWIKAIKKLINNNNDYLFILISRREKEISYNFVKTFLNQISKSKNVLLGNDVFRGYSQSYHHLSLSDFSITNNFSDAFLEGVSNNIPGLVYQAKCKKIPFINKFFRNFQVSNEDELLNRFDWMINKQDELKNEMTIIQKKIGMADGKCIKRILDHLVVHLGKAY